MRLTDIVRLARTALGTEKGRDAGRGLTDRAADAAGRVVGPRHSGKVDSARRAAHSYLDKQGPQDPGRVRS
ncbi:hypothetical protein ACT3TZ_06090 [Brachybacterium sp. AOP25-B2-12]|uniref:hypothetical protein n=1 Tax=Brachybacterium sp. AOP25-B2-12 TaxID=3457710 RepID=UPI004034B25E